MNFCSIFKNKLIICGIWVFIHSTLVYINYNDTSRLKKQGVSIHFDHNKNTKYMTPKYSYLKVIIVVIIVIAAILFFQNLNKPKDTLKVGAVLSLSGSTSSFYGEYNKNAIELAKGNINKSGGISGRNIEVLYEDSGGNKIAGLQGLNKLIESNVKAIITDISPVAVGIAPVSQSSKVLLVATSASNPTISTMGDYIFRTKMAAQKEGIEAAKYITENIQPKSVAFLYQNSDYGVGVFKTFSEQIKNAGINIVADQKFAQGASDMRTQLSVINSKKPDLIIVAAFPKEVGMLLKQAREIGISAKFFAHSGSIGPDIESVAGEAANGLTFLTELDKTSSEFKNFSEQYSQKYNKTPELFSSNAYDAFMLIAQSAEKCGGFDTFCMKDTLSKIKEYKGVSGSITFDENGDITDRDLLCQVKSVHVDASGNVSSENDMCDQ